MSKSVLITGGSRGIGAATAVQFARMGYKVAITYNRSEESVRALRETMLLNGAEFVAIKADCKSSLQTESAVKQTVAAFGSLDVMVNNAGIAMQRLITETNDDEWQNILNTNLSGTFYGCREAARVMIPKGRGSIINVSSIWGVQGASMEVAYSATKSGIIGITKALAKELGPSGIRVNCVAPGVIDTDMNANLDLSTFAELSDSTALGRIGTPDEVARAIYYLANDADFITGQVLGIDGGFF